MFYPCRGIEQLPHLIMFFCVSVTVIKGQDELKNVTKIIKDRFSVPTKKPNTDEIDNTKKPKIQVTVTGRAMDQSPKIRLKNHLMNGYEKDIHPALEYRDPVNVQLGMALIHVDLDERKSLITVDGWMRLTWNDPKLKWNPDDFDNVTQMHFR